MQQEIEEGILEIDVRMAALRAIVQFGEVSGALGPELSRYLDDLQNDLQVERDRLKARLARISH